VIVAPKKKIPEILNPVPKAETRLLRCGTEYARASGTCGLQLLVEYGMLREKCLIGIQMHSSCDRGVD
jgi:hypothetical protein